MMTSAIETLKTWITESDNIVFFGGAGVSTESGIPDFRSTDGLYHQKFDYPPETILSHTFFYQHPEYFFKFYREKMLPLDYQPNEAHKKLAALEQAGKLRAIVTQNIDGLHQKAGSKCVYELHGSIWRNYCTKCGKSYSAEFIRDSGGVAGLNYYRHFVGDDPTMEGLVRHVEHFLELGGEKTLCIGGDLDGCEALAGGLRGVQDVPLLYIALQERGYSEGLLEDIFWNNLRRIL